MPSDRPMTGTVACAYGPAMDLEDLRWQKSSYSVGSANCVEIAWRKSSRSSNTANCVEVGPTPRTTYVRDTKDRAGGTLAFDQQQWGAFLNSLRS